LRKKKESIPSKRGRKKMKGVLQRLGGPIGEVPLNPRKEEPTSRGVVGGPNLKDGGRKKKRRGNGSSTKARKNEEDENVSGKKAAPGGKNPRVF